MAQQGEDERAVRIGPYRLLRPLGEGTLGRVVLAEQDDPRREVALKLLRFTHGSEDDRLRFRDAVERLGALDHPDIARVLGAGQVGAGLSGTPYLVMEAVRGEPLLAYARHQGLSLQARLQLVARLARAVHHAHTCGVLHRDLRPANVLVDDSGQLHILDFGLAQLFGDDLSRYTQLGQRLALLVHLSPEQCTGGPVDARSDVYALGVLAYELLSGELPLAPPQQNSVPAAIAQLRGAAPVPLADRLPEASGDLDTVIMKALAADASARYGSAAEFAADLERYLAAHPIEARPPTPLYVLRLFVRRHRRVAIATAAGAVTTLLVLAGSLGWALHEHAARRRAEQRLAMLDAGLGGLQESFGLADAGAPDLGLRQWLDRARLALGAGNGTTPAGRAVVARSLATAYAQLGDTAQALQLLDAAGSRLQPGTAADGEAAAALRLTRAAIQIQSGARVEAQATLQPLLQTSAPSSAPARRIWLGARELAIALAQPQRAVEESIQANAALLADARQLLGGEDPLSLAIELQAVELLRGAGRLAEARSRGEALLPRLRRGLGPQHPRTLALLQAQAMTLRELGDAAAAEPLLRELLTADEQVYGAAHPYTLAVQRLYAGQLRARDAASAEAEAVLRRAADAARKHYGADAPETLAALDELADSLESRGQWQEAGAVYGALIETQQRLALPDDASTLGRRQRYARLLAGSGREDEALEVEAGVAAAAATALGPAAGLTLAAAGDQAELLARRGRTTEARELLDRTLAALAATPASAPAAVADRRQLHQRAAALYEALGDPAAAEAQRALLAGLPPT